MSTFIIEYPLDLVYMDSMPTSKKILNFAVDDNLSERLDDFRFNNRINTLSEAIRRLLDKALESEAFMEQEGKAQEHYEDFKRVEAKHLSADGSPKRKKTNTR